MSGELQSLRIIVPVYDEAENVSTLLDEIAALPPLDRSLTVDFVDDSPGEETVNAIIAASRRYRQLNITFMRRTGNKRINGLCGAVTDGMRRAQEEGDSYILVMDGDGQHPPDVIPSMLQQLNSGHNLVVASRYIPGGSNEGLEGFFRQVVSRGSTWVARSLFPIRLRKVTDPMTGLFAARLDAISTNKLEATGFKILLELVLSTPDLRIAEVPVIFRNRNAGDSKAAAARGIEYLQQLARLRFGSLLKPLARHLNRRKDPLYA